MHLTTMHPKFGTRVESSAIIIGLLLVVLTNFGANAKAVQSMESDIQSAKLLESVINNSGDPKLQPSRNREGRQGDDTGIFLKIGQFFEPFFEEEFDFSEMAAKGREVLRNQLFKFLLRQAAAKLTATTTTTTTTTTKPPTAQKVMPMVPSVQNQAPIPAKAVNPAAAMSNKGANPAGVQSNGPQLVNMVTSNANSKVKAVTSPPALKPIPKPVQVPTVAVTTTLPTVPPRVVEEATEESAANYEELEEIETVEDENNFA